MIDSKFLEKRFGIDVILQNLSPEEKYLCTSKNILNDSSISKIDHITNSIFSDSKSLLKFVAEVLDIDVVLDSEHLPSAINDILKVFNEYSIINPYFDINDIETWCDESENIFLQCKNILDNYGLTVQASTVLNEASTVSDDRIKENIYNELDDNSILLLYGLLTNNFNTGYTTEMRHTVFNDIKNNREKSRIGDIILHSLKENNSSNVGSVIGNYGIDVCKKVQTNGTVLLNEFGSIKSISKIGDNKYVVCSLNESTSQLSSEDNEKILLVGTLSDFQNELESHPDTTPDAYVMQHFDDLHSNIGIMGNSQIKDFFGELSKKSPELAEKIQKEYGSDFMND